MRPQQIHLTGIPRLTLLILSWSALMAPQHSAAQASCSGTVQSVTYDTAISSSGSTTYALSFPQYPTTGGYTLLSAVLVANATTTAIVSFANTTGSIQDFYPELDRKESIKSGATTLVNVNNSPSGNYLDGFNDEVYLTPMGMAGDHITDGPEIVYNNDPVVYDSIINGVLTSFKGSGTMSLSYQTKISLNNVNIGVDQTPAPTFSDNISFSLTYYFCNPVTLAENILTFSAYRENTATIALSWISTKEQAGRKYVVEVSRAGGDFEDISTQNADPVDQDATYAYNYSIGAADRGQLFFRIKQVDADGRASYSEVRIINLGGSGLGSGGPGSGDFFIYPNPPTSYINVQFPAGGPDWQVDILSADGGLIQRNTFHNTSTGRVDFIRALASGTYFVRATDLQSVQSRTASFVIR